MSESYPEPPVAAPRFDVEPYRMERDYTLYALLICTGVMSLLAVGLGYGASWLCDLAPPFEWIILAVVALALAGTGWVLVGQTRLRHEGVAAVIVLIASGLAFASALYFSYLRVGATVEENARRWLPYRALVLRRPEVVHAVARDKVLGKDLPAPVHARLLNALQALPAAQQQRLAVFLVKDLEALLADPQHPRALARWRNPGEATPIPADQLAPELRVALAESLAEFSFGDYVNWKVTRGVRMWLPRIKTVHFGYTGSVIYLSLVGLGMFLVPWVAMCYRASRPLCLQCHQWKTNRPLGRLTLPEEQVVQTFKDGAVVQLASESLMADGQPGGTVRVKLALCDECRETSDVQVILERIGKDKEGKDAFSEILLLTYPGLSLKVLESLFTPAPVPPSEEAPPNAS